MKVYKQYRTCIFTRFYNSQAITLVQALTLPLFINLLRDILPCLSTTDISPLLVLGILPVATTEQTASHTVLFKHNTYSFCALKGRYDEIGKNAVELAGNELSAIR